MSAIGTCEWSQRLRVSPLATLSEDELEAFVRHASGCARCMDALGDVSAPSDLLGELSEALSSKERADVDITPPIDRLNELVPDYEILGELGRGGMGVVFRARQRSLDRIVALKILPALLAVVRPEAAERFRREATLAARLKHSNIIGVHDFGEADGTLYYAMELIEGRNLADLLAEMRAAGAAAGGGIGASFHKGLSVTGEHPRSSDREAAAAYYRRVVEWIADVADAVAYAHGQGVLHRDIKPANLIVGADHRLLITDFGLARPIGGSGSARSRVLIGTSRYMSPERIDPSLGPVDGRADVYALGATLYELLTLRPVIAGDDDGAVLREAASRDPAAPSGTAPHLPRELDTVCLKALARRPAERYPSAQALAEDLRRWLLGLPILARRPSAPVRAVRYVRRHKAASAVLAALAVAVVGVGMLSFMLVDAARREHRAAAAAHAQRVSQLALGSREAFRSGRYNDALALLDAMLELEPGSLDARRERARVLNLQGHSDRAVDELESVLADAPDDWHAHYLLGMVLDGLERHDEARVHFEAAERLGTETAAALYTQALLEVDDNAALLLLDRASELEPHRFEVMLERSRRLYALGRHEEGLIEAEKIAAARPHWAVAQVTLAHALCTVGRFDESIDRFTMAIDMEPTNPLYWHNRSLAYTGAGDFDAAVADASHAIELDPTLSQSWFAMARAKAGKGDFAAALADMSSGIQLEPGNKEAYIERSAIHHRRGDFESMVSDASRVIQLDPDEPRGFQNRLAALVSLGQLERALPDAQRHVELLPNDPDAHANCGKLLLLMGRFEESTDAYARAIELRPLDEKLIWARAKASFRAGHPEKAASDATRVIELAPVHPQPVLLRAIAYWELGLSHLAVADLTAIADTDASPVSDYALLLLHVVHRGAGDTEAAAQALAQPRFTATSSWPARIAAMLSGDSSPDELFESAATPDERAEALFYVGAAEVADGHAGDGRRRLEECIALQRDGVLESDAARSLLRRLDEAD